jgi:hypothetical protein
MIMFAKAASMKKRLSISVGVLICDDSAEIALGVTNLLGHSILKEATRQRGAKAAVFPVLYQFLNRNKKS